MKAQAESVRFAADNMLGKLARWLRILGYDTVYDPALSCERLRQISRSEGRILLTRNRKLVEGGGAANVFLVKSQHFLDQLREVIKSFELDTESYLFTLCPLCNVQIHQVNKEEVKGLVPEPSYQLYEEFFRCPRCGRIYWPGTHAENITRRLKQM